MRLEKKLHLIELKLTQLCEKVDSSLEPKQGSTKWLSRKEVKDEYHVSYPTINKLEKEGFIKGYRLGARRVLFLRDEIDAALKNGGELK